MTGGLVQRDTGQIEKMIPLESDMCQRDPIRKHFCEHFRKVSVALGDAASGLGGCGTEYTGAWEAVAYGMGHI